MPDTKPIGEVRALAMRALDRGALISGQSTVTWDCAGRCSSPRTVTVHGRAFRRRHHVGVDRKGTPFWYLNAREERYSRPAPGNRDAPLWIDISVPCRKCASCLKRRTYVWRQRCVNEMRTAARTWFGTLTASPDVHFLWECMLAHDLRQRAVNWDRLDQDEQFLERARVGSKEVTKFFKKLRARTEAPLRYFLVVEPHKSGRPHWHVLLHELDAAQPVRKAELRDCWAHGFSQWKLVDADDAVKTARYVAKYLTKSMQARVRASIDYGSGALCAQSPGDVKLTPKTSGNLETAHAEIREGLKPEACGGPGLSTAGEAYTASSETGAVLTADPP